MLVGHLAEYSEFARNTDVIIGTDILRLANFTIDYDARKIIFHSLNPPTPAIDSLSNLLFLEILIQGRPVRLIADTGFPGILLFEARLLASVPNLTIADSQSNVTVGEHLHAKQTMLRDVGIGQRASRSFCLPGESARTRHASRNIRRHWHLGTQRSSRQLQFRR